MLTQELYILWRGAVGRLGHLGDVLEQDPVCVVQPGVFEVSRDQRLYCFLFRSLNTQEVSMRVQSIRTVIQPGDPACDRFFCPASEMPFRKMHGIAEAHNVAQEVGRWLKHFRMPGICWRPE